MNHMTAHPEFDRVRGISRYCMMKMKRICMFILAAAMLTAVPATPAMAAGEKAPGPLHVEGTQLVDEGGQPVQLRGVSTHGLAWFPEYVNAGCFKQLREWGANVVRLAMYTDEYGGYCNGGDRQALKQLVKDGVAWASEAGMYAIVDWHILSDSDPSIHAQEALAFFDEMSAAFADRDNVLYEICNEPNGGTDWPAVKAYALQVLPVIRDNDPDAVVIVGTPNWCQMVDQAAADPITEYGNVMYALHFYAGTHRDDLRARMEAAAEAGLPIFVSEFGTCDASGNGVVNEEQSDIWIELMDRLGTSYVNWNLSNKDESSAMLKSGCTKTSGFEPEDLSWSGRWVYELLSGEHIPAEPEAEADTPSTGYQTAQGGLQVGVTLVNSWEAEGETYRQYGLTLTDTSGTAREGWIVELAFDGDVTLLDGWNGEYSAQGNVLTVSSKDYNAAIPAGGTVTDVGFIVSGAVLAE